MEDITLKEIMDYCKENGVNLAPKNDFPTTVGNVQSFGDVTAEAYFTYYLTNSVEIENWRRSRQSQPQVEETNNITK